MICISLGKTSKKKIKIIAGDIDIVEIRLDLNDFTLKDIGEIFGRSGNLIATFRPGIKDDAHRKNHLVTAISSGAAYVDVEIEMNAEIMQEIVETARSKGCKIIISYHNFTETPEEKTLVRTVKNIFSMGGDIAKVACRVNSVRDCLSIISLYKISANVISIGMGELGKVTRIMGEFFGSPVSYTFLEGEKTAEGQIGLIEFKKIIKEIKNG